MAMLGSGFESDDYQAPMAEINTTPLVDVMLVLLVIFLVTAPMITHSIKLELPNEAAKQVQEKKAVTVSVDAAGQLYWEDAPITLEQMEDKMSALAVEDAKHPIHLRADKNTSYGNVSHILAAAQRFGLKNIGFLTTP